MFKLSKVKNEEIILKAVREVKRQRTTKNSTLGYQIRLCRNSISQENGITYSRY